jgi:hypothetical protein
VSQLAQQQFPARLAVVITGKENIDACTEWLPTKRARMNDGKAAEKMGSTAGLFLPTSILSLTIIDKGSVRSWRTVVDLQDEQQKLLL